MLLSHGNFGAQLLDGLWMRSSILDKIVLVVEDEVLQIVECRHHILVHLIKGLLVSCCKAESIIGGAATAEDTFLTGLLPEYLSGLLEALLLGRESR